MEYTNSEKVSANYFKGRSTLEESLYNRFYDLATHTGKLTISNLYKVWVKLIDERTSARTNLITAKQVVDRYIGTGLDGISAQINYDKAYKKASIYDNYMFEKLHMSICEEILDKYHRLIAKNNKTQSDIVKIQILNCAIESLQSVGWEQFRYIIKELLDKDLKFELSARNIVGNCKKRF